MLQALLDTDNFLSHGRSYGHLQWWSLEQGEHLADNQAPATHQGLHWPS